MLKFYGDESFGRKQPGSQGCYAVAGYLTSGDMWREITDDWGAVLDRDPRIEYFHMAECFAAIQSSQDGRGLGQFRGMRPQQAINKLSDLVSVLERHGNNLACVQSIITWDCFAAVFNESERRILVSPYSPCVFGVIGMCQSIVRDLGARLPVHFNFDEQGGCVAIHQGWSITRALYPEDGEPIGSIKFANDQNCIPLQCADLLAWQTRRQFVQPAEDHGRPRAEYTRLRRSTQRWYSHIWSEPVLRQRRQEEAAVTVQVVN